MLRYYLVDMNIAILGQLFIVFLALIIGLGSGFSYANYTKEKPQKPILTLPTDAKSRNISNCTDGDGTHFTQPQFATTPDKIWGGPTYVYWQPTGEVTAIEYHISEEGLKTLTGPNAINPLDGEATRDDRGTYKVKDFPFPLHGAAYESFDLKFQDQGHEGFPKPHYDIHIWTKSPQERAGLICPKKAN